MLQHPPKPDEGIVQFAPAERVANDPRDQVLAAAMLGLAFLLAHLAVRISLIG